MKYSASIYAKALAEVIEGAEKKSAAEKEKIAEHFLALVRRNGDEIHLRKILEEAARYSRRREGVHKVTLRSASAAISVKQACEKFMTDAVARNLSEAMVRKLRNLTNEVKEKFGAVSLRSLTVDDLRSVTQAWVLAPITKQKRLEMLRSFFRFCVDSGWMERNPAKAIRFPMVKYRPTLPFSEEQMERIFWACEVIREKHPQMKPGIERKLRALVLLMRHAGLRISDAVILTRDRVKDGKLFLYQAKTDEPVWVPLPEIVLAALDEIAVEGHPYYFWTGRGKLRHAPTEWQARLKKLFTIAGVIDPRSRQQSHRFRDTFAVGLLEKGIPLETVSILLGHKNISVTERHYAPWVRSRQEALELAIKAVLK